MKTSTSFSLCALVLVGLLAGCGGGGGGSGGSNGTSTGGTGGGTNGGGAGTNGVNGNSTAATYKLAGSVTKAGAALPGATVTLGGFAAATAFTNSSGNYCFTGLRNGTYTVSVTKPDYTCLPKKSSQTINGANRTGVTFTAALSSTIFYVIDDANQLAALDIGAKNVTMIGSTGVFLNDIAFDPNGTLFGISGDQLFKIDLATAVATPLPNPLIIGDTTSLEFSTDGTLYTANTSLCTVDPLTGIGAVIGSAGAPYKSSGDLAFLGSQLYLTSTYNLTSDSLVKLNAASGAGTFLGPIGFVNVYGLASNDGVTLYGFAGSKVIKIDPVTGVGTLFWDINGMNGLGPINGAAFH